MCKFTNRLFVFALLLPAFGKLLAQPVGGKIRPGNSRNVVSDLLEVLYDDYSDNGFQREDILYDQRQKGTENYQLKVDGVVIGLAPQMGSNWLHTMAEYYLSEMMLRQSTPEPDTNQLYEKDPGTDTESGAVEGVTKIPEQSKNDLESRQHQIIAPHNSSRTPSQLFQLLKMLKTSKA
ncbi:uncharacterized protein LOC128263391 [Drosophila gunungcola]|uniref:Uncharacterized protein n=1 Tax=Drosophila gunungcola TaxID=103775 RepID=A0A9P9YRR7_9MUSC|nr:uncharacterized protein LOC128263391 [Drosophila gunungcola]KAI8041862.1 hypothetical protein M5D96_003157 [Drosophila gunungcola]